MVEVVKISSLSSLVRLLMLHWTCHSFSADTGGGRSTAVKTGRPMAIRHLPSRKYFAHLTNLPPEILMAEGVRALYSTQWQIEIFFQSLQSYGTRGDLPRENSVMVEILILGKILFALLSTSWLQMVHTYYSSKLFPTERWLELCVRLLSDLL